jgi:virulence-associated protein VapD
MVCLNKKSFKLPFVEKDKFLLLMRLGLDYNRGQGSYYIKNYNNIEKLLDTIANILNAEKVTFLQSCVLCGKDFPCTDCKYYDLCATKDLPFRCVCPQCLSDDRVYEKYVEIG